MGRSKSTKPIKTGNPWPPDPLYRARYLVPDLAPGQRAQLKNLTPRLVFVAESPHIHEIESTDLDTRRPLCGRAGQAFWRMIGELVAGEESSDTSLKRLINLCEQGRFAVLNAVQFPLDPKIAAITGSVTDPVRQLGFSKVPPASYKKLSSTKDVESAIALLRARLVQPALARATVISLGNDAQWFVNRAVGLVGEGRHLMTVPHPSAWWRQGGKLRERARAQLTALLKEGYLLPQNEVEARTR